MKTKTHIRAGGTRYQHNETLVRDAAKGQGLKVKTHVRAGGTRFQTTRPSWWIPVEGVQRPARGRPAPSSAIRVSRGHESCEGNRVACEHTRRGEGARLLSGACRGSDRAARTLIRRAAVPGGARSDPPKVVTCPQNSARLLQEMPCQAKTAASESHAKWAPTPSGGVLSSNLRR